MSFAVKLDEDLSPQVAQPLLDGTYTVASVAGQGWSGLPDAELWERILQEKVFFITADKGFGDIRAFPPGTHPGILLLRPDRESIVEYRALVARVLTKYELLSLAGAVTVATPRSIRIRRPTSE